MAGGKRRFNVRASSYWSATASAQFAIGAWTVPFLFDMTVGVSDKSTPSQSGVCAPDRELILRIFYLSDLVISALGAQVFAHSRLFLSFYFGFA